MVKWFFRIFVVSLLAVASGQALAQNARIAVAANFTATAQELAKAYGDETGQSVELTFGSTGQLYAQITQGAPFDGFLSADAATPERLIAEGLATPDSRFTYAVGQLVLYSTDPDRITGPESLKANYAHLAIAEPATAPYGAAARQVIDALGAAVEGRLVVGQSIAQAYQYVASGNAELGFVALSQVVGIEGGSRWVVDPSLYDPIVQDGVLLSENAVAADFFAFVQSEAGRAIIAGFGYRAAP